MTQTEQIIALLRRDGRISNFRCMETKLSNRLAARIDDLKKKGWEFRKEIKDNKDCVYVVTKDPLVSEYRPVRVQTLFS